MEFLKILKAITKDKTLTRTDICVMAVFVTYAQYPKNWIAHKTIQMSINEIGAVFESIPNRSIRRSIKHLEELQYITPIRANGKKSSYKILIDIPIIQEQTEDKPKQKRKTNIIETDADYLSGVNEAVNANRFLINKGDK